jgi:hypothetical protein
MDEFSKHFNQIQVMRTADESYAYQDAATGEFSVGTGTMPMREGYPEGMEAGSAEAQEYDLKRSQVYGLPVGAIDPENIKAAQGTRQGEELKDPNWIAASRILHDYMNRARTENINIFGVDQAVNMDAKTLGSAEEYASWGVQFMNRFDNNISRMLLDISKVENAPMEVQKSMYYLMETADREGITGDNFLSGLGYQLIDPMNWVGLGTFGIGMAGKYAGKQFTKATFKQALKDMVSIKPTGVKLATSAEGAMFAAADNLARQDVKIGAGVQDEVNVGEAALATTAGAAIGYQAPSVLEGAGKGIKAGFDKLNKLSPEEEAARSVGDLIDPENTGIEPPLPEKGDLVVDTPAKVNPVVDDLPLVDFDSLEGAKIFPIAADLTKAGGVYEGIDSSKIDVPIILQGGPDYPNLESSRKAGLVWAFDGSGKSTMKLNKDAEYALVVAMNPDSHKTNATVTKAMLETTLAYIRDGRMTEDTIAKLDAEIGKTRAGTANVPDWPGLGSDGAAEYIRNATFEQRKTIMAVMTGKTAQDNGAPNLQKILDATADARYVGLNSYDSIMLVEIDRKGGNVKLGEESGTPEHLSYEYGIKGKPVARVPFMAAQTMFPKWFEKRLKQEAKMNKTGLTNDGKPLTKKPEEGRGRAFYLSLPVEEITAEKIAAMKASAVEKIQSPLQAKLLVNALDDGWQTTDNAVKDGGITGLDWVKEASASPESSTLTFPMAKDGEPPLTRTQQGQALQQDIKDGKIKIYKLKDSRTFFGLSDNYNYYDEYGLSDEADYWTPNPNYKGEPLGTSEKALVSVVSNDFGAKGIGATTVMKAIEEGATVLDCFAVRSDDFPSGFLPRFYGTFGFREVGRIAFNPDYVTDTQLADMKTVWAKRGWKEGDGYPDIVVMKWQGDESGREQYTRRFIADNQDSPGGETPGGFQATASTDGRPAGDAAGGEPRASDGSGNQGDVPDGNRRGTPNKLVAAGQELLNATDAQLQNLGISIETVNRIRAEMKGATE